MTNLTLWTLVVSNIFVFVIGGALTYLSLQARRRVEKSKPASVRTVGRLHREPTAEDESESVDEFVFPEHAGARVAVDMALGAPIQPVADLATHLKVVAAEAAEGAPAAGAALADVLIPGEATVIADMDGQAVADGATVVVPGHRYLVATDPAVADDVKKLFRG